MDFAYSEKVQALRDRVQAFMEEHVYPNEAAYARQLANAPDRWRPAPIVELAKYRPARPNMVSA